MSLVVNISIQIMFLVPMLGRTLGEEFGKIGLWTEVQCRSSSGGCDVVDIAEVTNAKYLRQL